MKKTTAACIILAALPVAASAQTLSTTLRLGAVRTPDVTFGIAGGEDALALKTGWTIGAALGWAMPNGFRAEGELGFLRAPVKSDGGVPISGAFKEWLLMANGYYDFAPMGALRPFVGAGAGAARVEENFTVFEDGPRVFRQHDRSRTSFAYQARVGAHFDLSGHPVSLAYRYVHVKDTSFTPAPNILIKMDALQHHVLELGLTF